VADVQQNKPTTREFKKFKSATFQCGACWYLWILMTPVDTLELVRKCARCGKLKALYVPRVTMDDIKLSRKECKVEPTA